MIHRCRVCSQIWEVPPFEEGKTVIIFCEAQICSSIRQEIETLPDDQADETTIQRIISSWSLLLG